MMITFRILFSLFFVCVFGSLFSQEEDGETPGIEQQDIRALREWIDLKRQVTVKERGGNLSVSGEVRTELQATSEKKQGVQQRVKIEGSNDHGSHDWDVEFNLMLDYHTDRTWAAVKIEFDNKAGTDNGSFDRISLERALFGVCIMERDQATISATIGRRNFGNVFDSKIQFGSFMDGIVLKYDRAIEDVGNFYVHGGPFLVDGPLNQYSYVAEIALLDIAETGLYSKLSLINWKTKKTKSHLRNLAFSFRNVQLTLGHRARPAWLSGKMARLYGALLVNTAAQRCVETGSQRQSVAWYAGCSIGELLKQGDWALDVNYQWVQNQAVPDFDGNGIGRGNFAKYGLYSRSPKGKGGAIEPLQGVGKGNFKGFVFEFVYNLTNTITLYQSYSQSVNCTQLEYRRFTSPALSYKQYELELIYLF